MHKTAEETYRNRRQFFNAHAESWLDRCYKNPESGQMDLHAEKFRRLFALAPLKPGDRVLDVGCGSGVLVPMILERIQPTGMLWELDFAEKMIAENRRLHPEPNIRFIVADATEAPLEADACDVIFCFACFPHFDRKPDVVRRLHRILRPGGTLVLAHFSTAEEINRRHATCPAVMHDHLPDQAAMRALLQEAHWVLDQFIEEPGFYCILAHKPL